MLYVIIVELFLGAIYIQTWRMLHSTILNRNSTVVVIDQRFYSSTFSPFYYIAHITTSSTLTFKVLLRI